MRISHRLRATTVVVGLLLTGLLSSCGETTPPVDPPETESTLPPITLNVAGTWKDEGGRYEICEYVEPNLEVYMQLEQNTGQGDFSGSLIIGVDDGTEYAFVSGRAKGSVSGDKVTGTASIVNDLGDTFTFGMALSLSESRLTGKLLGKEFLPCDSYENPTLGDDTILIEVDLQRTDAAPPTGTPREPVEDDALEPNNSADEAAEIDLDYQAELVLQDEDWFEFTLSEEQLVTLDVQADDASYFYVDAIIYDASKEVLGSYEFYGSNPKPKQIQLSAGVYTLRLSGNVNSQTRGYSLSLSSEPLPDAAFEPNESAQSATSLTLGAEALAMYLSDDDEDWFSFTLATPQIVTFEVESSGSSLRYTLLDSAFNEQRRIYVYEDSPDDTVVATLAAGTYYLKIYRYYDATAYSVRVSSEDLPDSTFEPNDAADQAAELTFNASGNFSGEMYLMQEDEDWFALTLNEARLVTFNLGKSYYDFSTALYNADLEEQRSSSYRGYAFTVALEAGTHYLRVYGYDYGNGLGYSLKVNSEPIPDAEHEPNDSFNAATPIQLPFTDALYMAQEDEDWFSFTLSEEQLVTLERSDTDSYRVNGAFYTADGTKLSGKSFSLSSQGIISFILPADSYVLSLSTASYYSDRDFAYSVSISSEAVPDLEYEPNNSRDEAHAIALGFSDDNLVISSGDEDWFSFTLDSAAQINLTLKTRSSSLYGYLYDAEGNYVREQSHIYEGLNSPVLPAGTYYLKFSHHYSNAPKYGLSVVKK